MRLVTFKLKQTNGEARPQVGALAKDRRSVFNLTDALDDLTLVTDAAGAGGLLGCFDLAGPWLPRARQLYERLAISSEGSAQHSQWIISSDILSFLAPVPRPGKLICVGLNYRDHAEESNMPIPTAPVIFSKFSTAVIGPRQSVLIPPMSSQVDYEAELAVVMGRRAKQVPVERALDHVLGYTIVNDVSARDFQFADNQWQRGK